MLFKRTFQDVAISAGQYKAAFQSLCVLRVSFFKAAYSVPIMNMHSNETFARHREAKKKHNETNTSHAVSLFCSICI